MYRAASPENRQGLLFLLAEEHPECAILLAATEGAYGCESARLFLQIAARINGHRALDRLCTTGLWDDLKLTLDRFRQWQLDGAVASRQ